jgi:hypothetical protein
MPSDTLAIYARPEFSLQVFFANDIIGIIENKLERVSRGSSNIETGSPRATAA